MYKDIKNDLMPLFGILQSCGKIMYYSDDFTDAELFYHYDEQAYFNASLTLLTNIGELVSNLSDELKENHSEIDWLNIKGLRNKIAHDYKGVDIVVAFEIIKDSLPQLKRQISNIINAELSKRTFDLNEYNVAKSSQSEYFKFVDFGAIGF